LSFLPIIWLLLVAAEAAETVMDQPPPPREEVAVVVATTVPAALAPPLRVTLVLLEIVLAPMQDMKPVAVVEQQRMEALILLARVATV